jgi:hypothetical protein
MKNLSGAIGLSAVLLIGLTVASPVWAQSMKGKMKSMKPMKGMMAVNGPTIPAVTGYSEGQKILFIHTETSDPKIAKILMDMMGGSPVLVVPSLAKAPKNMLAPVYVFTNGMKGDGPMGPLGGQPDIFEHPPGSSSYSPLREVNLVTWKDSMKAHTLKSVTELRAAIKSGEVSVKKAGVVVNMPFLTWPGGKR